MFTRVFLFLATNLAILLVFGLVMAILEATGILPAMGPDSYVPLLIFAGLFGFGGAFVSLALSKWVAKRATGARVIEHPANESEAWLVRTVERLAGELGIGVPEVAIYQAPDPNAFATGARRDASLVAVSTGLLSAMKRDEVEAVLAHEVAHVANGDMVTLTLIQGVVNTFVIFFARVIGRAVDGFLSRGQGGRGGGIGYFATVIVAQMVLGILASIIVMWFSRWREFRADAGSAKLVGAHKMAAALRRLQGAAAPVQLPDSMQAFGIRGGGASLLASLFRSHPPIAERIARLEQRA